MEDVLELYAEPYDPLRPVLCMDEQPMTLHLDVRPPIPASQHYGKRVDYEYKRVGTVSLFMYCEPLVGWRQAMVRERRTKTDWAETIAEIIEFGWDGLV